MRWLSGTLHDLVSLQRGHDLPEHRRQRGSVPVVGSAGPNGFHNEAKQRGPGVTIGRSGASIGHVTYVAEDYWPHNTCLYVTDFKGNNPRYVSYLLSTLNLRQLNSGAAQPSLNRNFVYSLKIRFPNPDQQDRIASILSAYDDLIENNRRRIQLLEQSAQLLYKEWFVRLRFPGHESVKIEDDVPEGWEKATAFEVMGVLSGGTPKTNVSSYWGGDIPFFTPKDATDCPYTFNTERTLTEDGLRNCNSRLYPKDTVFIAARGTVGKLALAQTDMAMNQTCYALVAHPPLNQHFLYCALVEGIEQLRSRAVGSVFNAIIRDTFKQIPFLVPARTVIRVFSEHVTPMLRQIDTLSHETRKLAQARDLLLPRLMAGRTK